MGRIRFKRFYTDIVEHYLRMAVRHHFVKGSVPQEWHSITTKWIEGLSEEDREFIRFVFDRKHYNSFEGCSCFQNGEVYDFKLNKLALLEKQFAIDTGLYFEPEDENRSEPVK